MKIHHALLRLAPFALDADRGADGLIILSPTLGGVAYARQRGALLLVRVDAPATLILIDAEGVKRASKALKEMHQPSHALDSARMVFEETQHAGEGLVAEETIHRAPLPTVALARLPKEIQARVQVPISLPVPAPYIEIDRETWRAVQRVATCAARPRDDRAGLEVVQIGPLWADATNEVTVARMPVLTGHPLRVPAELLKHLVPTDTTIGVGEGPGGIVFGSSGKWDEAEIVLVVDDPKASAAYFPPLDGVWERFTWASTGVQVSKGELRRAVSAAKAAATKNPVGLVVDLDVQERLVVVTGADVSVSAPVLPRIDSDQGDLLPREPKLGRGAFAAGALLDAVGAMGATIEVIMWPGSHPVCEMRSGDQRVLISGLTVQAQPFASPGATGQGATR